MTEQLEDDFWAEERARDTAARGRQVDPSACGTCRNRVAAGGQVEHGECAQRAILLPAPDSPGYELLTGLSGEELAALPPRFHIPAYMESSTPQMWVCAVCWGDGWVTGWPCKTAVKHGLRVFTPEHDAETAAKRQAAELAEHRAEANTPLVVSRFDVAMEPAPEEEPGLTVGAVAEDGRPVALVFDGEARVKVAGWLTPVVELEQQLAEMTRLRDNAVRALYRDDVDTDIDLEETIAAPFYGPGWCWEEHEIQPVVREAASAVRPAFGKLTQQRDEARARVAELETELKKYVGAEPTIAEEMAYVSRCLFAVYDLCAEAKRTGSLGITPEAVEQAANGEWTADTPRPALPWAHVMDDSDLHLFLDDLVSAALNRWQTDQDGPIPDRVTLAEIEQACARWRTPGQGYRSDEPARQPPTRAYPPALPWAALMDGEDLAGFLRDLDAGMRDAARQAHFAGRPQAPAVLTALEHACATWRLIAETQHAHNTAAGPDAETEGR
jgi:hypothetical protein